MPTTIIKTVKPSGGDYPSLSAALTAQARDLTAADQIAEFDCYSMLDTSAVDTSGMSWITDATRYVRIYGHAAYDGWAYKRVLTDANSTSVTDYVLVVTLTSGNFTFAHAASDGSDIRFWDATDGVEIPWWISAYDSGAQTATIYVRTRNMAHTHEMYYGKSSPAASVIPPLGPWAKYATNPVIAASGYLPENIIYDASTYYLLVGGVNGNVYLAHSADLESWTDDGSIFATGDNSSTAPCLVKSGATYYLFYGYGGSGSEATVRYATASAIGGPYTYQAALLTVGTSGAWDDSRAYEVYVFLDGSTWRMLYMGDAGSAVEQVGMATASTITGPYTKSGSNPILAFGGTNSYDAGTVADPAAIQVNGIWWISYASSRTNAAPWVNALAETSDWSTFKKHNVFLGVGDKGSWDADNALRGAIFAAGDYYYTAYAGLSGGTWKTGMAKAPAKTSATGYPAQQVFDLYEDFSGGMPSQIKIDAGALGGSATVSGGVLTVASGTGSQCRVTSIQEFGIGCLFEAVCTHPGSSGTQHIGETGLLTGDTNRGARIYDYNNAKFQRETRAAGTTTANMAENVSASEQTDRIWLKDSSHTEFAINAGSWGEITSNNPSGTMPAFFMSYADSGQTTNFLVNSVKVRKYQEPEPSITVGTETSLLAGVRNTNKYRLVISNSGSCIYSTIPHLRIEGIQVSCQYGGGDDACLWFTECSDIRLIDVLVYDSTGSGIIFQNGSLGTMNNCCILNSASRGIDHRYTTTVYAYNCTVVNSATYGFISQRDLYCTNCYAGGNVTADYEGTANVTSHSSDLTGNTQTAFSTSSGAFFTNITAGSENPHIGASSALIGVGTNLNGDTYWIDPGGLVDIDGNPRSVAGAWSVGIDEYTQSGVSLRENSIVSRSKVILGGIH